MEFLVYNVSGDVQSNRVQIWGTQASNFNEALEYFANAYHQDYLDNHRVNEQTEVGCELLDIIVPEGRVRYCLVTVRGEYSLLSNMVIELVANF